MLARTVAGVQGYQRGRDDLSLAVNGLLSVKDVDLTSVANETASDQALCRGVLALMLYDNMPDAHAFTIVDTLRGRTQALFSIQVVEGLAPWFLESYLPLLVLGASIAAEEGKGASYLVPLISEVLLYSSRVQISKQ
eukprot:7043916-Prymnesium_polylepis.1